MATEAQIKASRKYENKCKHFMVRLRLDKDADILEWLRVQKSGNERIKELIRHDIEKGAI